MERAKERTDFIVDDRAWYPEIVPSNIGTTHTVTLGT